MGLIPDRIRQFLGKHFEEIEIFGTKSIAELSITCGYISEYSDGKLSRQSTAS